ncbi:unnamed protein product, partial [Gongylonema pulchrum]|uniref:PPM-type phosphatase domain-containing protein n=1 Tax=Gongylonema pulchrum TaxID=637853 RepID=A0A183DGC9_9BILA
MNTAVSSLLLSSSSSLSSSSPSNRALWGFCTWVFFLKAGVVVEVNCGVFVELQQCYQNVCTVLRAGSSMALRVFGRMRLHSSASEGILMGDFLNDTGRMFFAQEDVVEVVNREFLLEIAHASCCPEGTDLVVGLVDGTIFWGNIPDLGASLKLTAGLTKRVGQVWEVVEVSAKLVAGMVAWGVVPDPGVSLWLTAAVREEVWELAE